MKTKANLAFSAPAGELFATAHGEGLTMGAKLEHFSAEVLFRAHGKYVARLLWQLGLAEQDIDDAVRTRG